jgi:hypothetical protein
MAPLVSKCNSSESNDVFQGQEVWASMPPKAEKSRAEKSEPAGAYFSAPDVSAGGSGETSALFPSSLS